MELAPDESDDEAHQPREAQGRSLSDADGGDSDSDAEFQRAVPDDSEDDEDNNSDDDHLANACPAVMIAPALMAESHWDEWEERVEDFARSLPDSEAAVAARALPDSVKAVAASTLDRGESENIKKHMDKHLAPAMPTVVPEERPHREKLRARELVFNLMVARPFGRQEVFSNPAAQAAMAKEWAALKQQKCGT